jgi:hypothetical protein
MGASIIYEGPPYLAASAAEELRVEGIETTYEPPTADHGSVGDVTRVAVEFTITHDRDNAFEDEDGAAISRVAAKLKKRIPSAKLRKRD